MAKKGSIVYAFETTAKKVKKLRPRKTGHSSGKKKNTYKDAFDYESGVSDSYRKHLKSMGM